MTDFLLNNAGPSIQLRVRKEILRDISPGAVTDLQNKILEEKTLRFIAGKQKDNGWIGNGFHGAGKDAGQYDNQETATKYMGEKGLHGTVLLNRAMEAYATTELTDPCYGTRGWYFSEFEIPAFGQNMIRCACIARAHYDDVMDIAPQIEVALASFRRVTEVDSILDVTRPAKHFRLFNNGERWPCRYHLEILAFTEGWKNPGNIAVLAEAFRRLMRTDRKAYIGLPVACWVGHPVGPLWSLTEGYSLADGAYLPAPDGEGVQRLNLEKIEWLVRCGLYGHVPALKEAVERIADSVDENGICRVNILEKEFRGWGPYGGLQLEPDWRSCTRKACDITCRALLILYYAGKVYGQR